jgi:hypothetical protein
MSLATILAQHGIGPEASAHAAHAARLRGIAEAHGLPVEGAKSAMTASTPSRLVPDITPA